MCKQTHLPLNITFCIFSGIPANEKIIYCKWECPKFNTNNWIIALRTVCDPVSTIPTQINNLLTQFFMRLAAFRFLDQKFGFSFHLTLTILKILKISKTPVKIVKLPVEIVELPTLAIQGMFPNNRVFCTEMKLRLFHKKPFEPCFGYIFVVTTWFCSLLSHSL